MLVFTYIIIDFASLREFRIRSDFIFGMIINDLISNELPDK
jgi:hypothetical protein